MKKVFILFIILFFLIASNAFTQPISAPLNIEEEDGSPSLYPYKLQVTDDTLTDNADGTASLNVASASIKWAVLLN